MSLNTNIDNVSDCYNSRSKMCLKQHLAVKCKEEEEETSFAINYKYSA